VFGGKRLGAFPVARIGGHHIGAGLKKGRRNRGPDAARAAGDNGRLAAKVKRYHCCSHILRPRLFFVIADRLSCRAS
jgi:hypothetical protein